MTEYIIREIREEELTESCCIIRKSFETVAHTFNITYEKYPMHGAFLRRERLENERKQGIKMYGVFVEKKQVGFVALEMLKDGTYEMQKLAVLPEYRHLGYGESLINFLKDYIKQQHGNVLITGVIEENDMLKRWYQEIGFKEQTVLNFKHLPFKIGMMQIEI